MYDILFSKGIDVRKHYFIDYKKEAKNITRFELLNQFEKSDSLKTIFSLEKCIKLKNKKYIQSIRADGTDIFQKAKELWDSRKYNNFNVDGIIFVPKYQYYPLRGGSWEYLFKWKPPQLNTIDFLIRVMKNDNNEELKNPFIEVINRPDGKQETILKQFKTLQLYVTGVKTIFGKNHTSNKKRIPILFNPFNMDNKNSEVYNLAKIILEDDGKMYAFNTITNEKVEIYDNIIVEFSYDNTKEIGFNCFIMEGNNIQPHTKIGNSVILWSGNHIGHHSLIKNNIFFSSHVVLSGKCLVEDYSWFGVNSCIKDGIKISEGSFIGMGSVVTKNTKAYKKYIGNPAKEYGEILKQK